jgi:hypothetical protein
MERVEKITTAKHHRAGGRPEKRRAAGFIELLRYHQGAGLGITEIRGGGASVAEMRGDVALFRKS